MSDNNDLEKKEREAIVRTVELVYEFMKENKNVDDIDALNFVREKYDYSNIEVKDSLELFSVQEGTVYVAYNYIKENPKKTKNEVVKEIKENYPELLDKYFEENK